MIVRNKQPSLSQVITTWKKQYEDEIEKGDKNDQFVAIHKALCSLPFNAGHEQISGVIGNSSWTEKDLYCDECNGEVEATVRFEISPEDEVDLCADCLSAAVKMLVANKKEAVL